MIEGGRRCGVYIFVIFDEEIRRIRVDPSMTGEALENQVNHMFGLNPPRRLWKRSPRAPLMPALTLAANGLTENSRLGVESDDDCERVVELLYGCPSARDLRGLSPDCMNAAPPAVERVRL